MSQTNQNLKIEVKKVEDLSNQVYKNLFPKFIKDEKLLKLLLSEWFFAINITTGEVLRRSNSCEWAVPRY